VERSKVIQESIGPVLNHWITKVGCDDDESLKLLIIKVFSVFCQCNTACVIRGGSRQVGFICIQEGTREAGHNVGR
jgi:hypothetical protein